LAVGVDAPGSGVGTTGAEPGISGGGATAFGTAAVVGKLEAFGAVPTTCGDLARMPPWLIPAIPMPPIAPVGFGRAGGAPLAPAAPRVAALEAIAPEATLLAIALLAADGRAVAAEESADGTPLAALAAPASADGITPAADERADGMPLAAPASPEAIPAPALDAADAAPLAAELKALARLVADDTPETTCGKFPVPWPCWLTQPCTVGRFAQMLQVQLLALCLLSDKS
jgi:hypothetical protein